MKKLIHTIFTSIALLVVLSSAGWAHHHHDGKVHFAIDQAQEADCCNDKKESSEQNSDCVFEKEYYHTTDNTVDLFKNIKTVFLYPLIPFLQDHCFQPYENNISKSYWFFITPDTPCFGQTTNGLRAPPTA